MAATHEAEQGTTARSAAAAAADLMHHNSAVGGGGGDAASLDQRLQWSPRRVDAASDRGNGDAAGRSVVVVGGLREESPGNEAHLLRSKLAAYASLHTAQNATIAKLQGKVKVRFCQ